MTNQNSPRYEGERPEYIVAYGCLANIAVFIGIAVIIALCCSCASHKTMTHAVNHTADSLVLRSVQEITASSLTKDTTSYTLTSTTTAADSLDELITEHIVTVTDSLGNVTTTTDRTTSRRHSSSTSASASESSSTTAYKSASSHYTYELAYGHWQLKDSAYQHSDTDTTASRPWYLTLANILEYILAAVLITAIAYTANKYISGK